MEEGEEEMIGINDLNELHQVNEVNEPNGESGHKEKNIPVQIEEKKEEIKESKKKEITPTNLIETKKLIEQKEYFESQINTELNNINNNNLIEEIGNEEEFEDGQDLQDLLMNCEEYESEEQAEEKKEEKTEEQKEEKIEDNKEQKEEQKKEEQKKEEQKSLFKT